MSAVKVRSYLESQARALGYKLSPEAFSQDKLPSNQSMLCFIQLGKASPSAALQQGVEFTLPVTVKLYAGKSANQKDIEAHTISETEKFLVSAQANKASSGFPKLTIVGYSVEPFSDQNLDLPVGIVDYEASYVLGF